MESIINGMESANDDGEYVNNDVFYQLGQVLGTRVDATTVKAHITRLMSNKNWFAGQAETLRHSLNAAETRNDALYHENGSLKKQVDELKEANRMIKAKRAKTQRDFEQVADYAERLRIEATTGHREEIKALEAKLEKAELDNLNFQVWFGQNSPTIIFPITPPRYKQLNKVAPLKCSRFVPQKRTAAWSVQLGGGKVKSVDALLQSGFKKYKARSLLELAAPEAQPLSAGRHKQFYPSEFQQFENGANDADPFYDGATDYEETSDVDAMDDSGVCFGSPTKQKKNAPKNSRPKKTVPKKQVGRKAGPKNVLPKPYDGTHLYADSDGEEGLVVPGNKATTNWRATGAGADDQDEEADTDEKASETEAGSDYAQEGDTQESYAVNCTCGSDHDVEDWIECGLCGAWCHSECYGYDVEAIKADNFVHLCPTCEDAEEREEPVLKNNKRKRSANDDEDKENDYNTGGKGKKPRNNAWTGEEKNTLIKVMGAHLKAVDKGEREVIYDAKLFALISQDCSKFGLTRNANAIKNMWNRELRAESGMDERRQKNPSKLKTSVQD